MGFETDLDVRCPHWFTQSDSKNFTQFCLGFDGYSLPGDEKAISMLERATGVSLEPLRKIAGQEFEIGEYLALTGDTESGRREAERIWRAAAEDNAAAWQPLEQLGECVQALFRALEAQPELLSGLNPTWPYFADHRLEHDLEDVLRMVDWARENGAQRVRLSAA